MAKKFINKNTYNITNEIDYKKLAEAIVSALEEQKGKKGKASPSGIILSSICSLTFLVLAILAALFAVCFLAIPYVKQHDICIAYFNNLPNSFFVLFLLVAMSIIMCILFVSSFYELQNENDKNYSVSLFSGMVSFAALIISVLTLYHTFCAQ